MIRMNWSGLLLVISFCFAMGCLVGVINTNTTQIQFIKEKVYIDTCIYKSKTMDTLNKETVYNEILNNNIQFPKIVLQQAIMETGHFKSFNCLIRNNLFGFSNEKHIKEGNKNGYLLFKHWKECIKWYANWQKKWYNGGSYYNFILEMNPGVDSSYIDLLKRVKV